MESNITALRESLIMELVWVREYFLNYYLLEKQDKPLKHYSNIEKAQVSRFMKNPLSSWNVSYEDFSKKKKVAYEEALTQYITFKVKEDYETLKTILNHIFCQGFPESVERIWFENIQHNLQMLLKLSVG